MDIGYHPTRERSVNQAEAAQPASAPGGAADRTAIITVESLGVEFPLARENATVVALQSIDLDIRC